MHGKCGLWGLNGCAGRAYVWGQVTRSGDHAGGTWEATGGAGVRETGGNTASRTQGGRDVPHLLLSPWRQRLCCWLQLLLTLGWESSQCAHWPWEVSYRLCMGSPFSLPPRASLEFFALKQQNLEKAHEGVAMGCFKNA